MHIYTHDTVAWALSGGACEPRVGAVYIGDRVYIGSQSILAFGTAVGNMVVIAANSFVNRPVPDRTIVAGTPACPIGHVVGDGASVKLVFDRPHQLPPDLATAPTE